MLDRVLTYVRAVLKGEQKGDPAVGRYLMDALGPSTEDLEKGGFNASLQVCKLSVPMTRPNFRILRPGHTYDLVFGESCTVASGSVISISPYYVCIGCDLTCNTFRPQH
jgi:hypothetical protein